MADVTGGVPPTNASPFAVPADMADIYDHFGDQTMYSVANAAALPASGNWKGRTLMAEDTGAVYRCTALPATWSKGVEDTGWINATLLNSWVAFGSGFSTPGYRRLNGMVYLRGVVKDGVLTQGTSIFTLPAGFRPSATLRFATVSSTAFAIMHVTAAGAVATEIVGSASSLSLDSVGPFPADA